MQVLFHKFLNTQKMVTTIERITMTLRRLAKNVMRSEECFEKKMSVTEEEKLQEKIEQRKKGTMIVTFLRK